MNWAKAGQSRGQMVLFSRRLDDVIGPDHLVRLFDDILSRIDWSSWEAGYVLKRGQPPIHPRVLSSVILYGLLRRIRSSRALEEALGIRFDFYWLVEARTIDHSTLSEFRRKNVQSLQDLFIQIALIAREMGCLSLQSLAFDGTRIRASNRRRGTRTPEKLRQMKKELADRFAELEAQVRAADTRDEESLGDQSAHTLPEDLADIQHRSKQIEAALEEIKRLEETDQKVPARVPLTDPQSRVMPNKEGGNAPNYTPLATVDVESGLIVAADVISEVNEDKHLIRSIEQVQQQFGLENPPAEVLADGLMSTGENLAACDERNITLYSPLPGNHCADNPAVRSDLTKPVAEQDRDRLPKKTIRNKEGSKRQQLDKQAFVYDAQKDCYWCPQGKPLPFKRTSKETRNDHTRTRYYYKADAEDCAACPLKDLCVQQRLNSRQVIHEEHEPLRIAHAKRMVSDSAKEKYSRRRHPGERPFAVIKHHFGARQFLLRGLKKVKQEWLWLSTAFNLHRLIGIIRSGVDPPDRPTKPDYFPSQ